MKRRLFFAAILVIAAFFVGRQVNRFQVAGTHESNRHETRQIYRLGPGARVEVRGINGSVDIRTAETDAADVRVSYEAERAEDVEGSRVVVEHDASMLIVRGESRGGFWRWLRGSREARVAVVMTVPRSVSIAARGVNGPLGVGAIEGSAEVAGVNGRVELAGVGGRVEVKGVNGNVSFAAARVDEQGIEVKGVNGNVEARLGAGTDADLEVKGHNGRLSLDLTNVTMQEREGHSRLRARLGAGGPPVVFKGLNGNLRLAPAGGAAESVVNVNVPPLPPPPPAAPPAPVN